MAPPETHRTADARAWGVRLFNRLNADFADPDPADAERWLRRAVELDPADARAAATLAALFERRYAYACWWHDGSAWRAWEAQPECMAWRDEAIRWYRRALAADPADATAATALGLLLCHEFRARADRYIYQSSCHEQPINPDTRHDDTAAHLLGEARECLSRTLEREPRNGAAAFELGRVLVWQTGADDEAQRWFLQAARLDARDTPAMQAIVELSGRRAGFPAQAARWLWPVAELGHRPAARRLAELLEQTQPDEARRWRAAAGDATDDGAACLDLWIAEDPAEPGEPW